MKTIKNSDIRFEINSRIIYVPSFEMKFYTVSQKEYYFKKTDADVTEAEVSGETKYYIDLDWSQLKYLGKGVMNYQCLNNIDDPSFPDGEYNQLIEKTTDYFIDTFTVNPEDEDESVIDMIEKEEEERKEADAVISGAVDTEIERATSAETALQEAIDAETSARTSADEALSQAIADETSARTDADAALQTAIDNEASARTSADETLQTNIDNEASARTHADETLQNNIDAEASARTTADETLNNAITAETSARTAADEALSGAVNTKLQDYYLKSETSGKTEIQTALDGKSDTGHTHDERYYRKDETSGATELEAALDRKLDASAYTPTDLSNYYTKDETSGKSEIASALSAKLDVTAYTPTDLSNYYTKSETSGKSEISTALDGKVNSSDFDAAISEKANKADVYTKGETSAATQISTALAAKLDTTAYTPTDLSNYYTKGETSGATELSTAFSGKQDTLIAGDNITISGNVISASGGGGDLSNYYTKAEVDEMSEVAAQGINDLNTNKLDVTAYTPTDLSQYWTSAQTQSAISQSVSGKQDTLVSGTNIKTVNNESLLGSGNITIQGGGGNDVVELTQAEYNSITPDPNVFYIITDATPIDLSNYYTKSQTSGATELSTAFASKQGTLSAGTGVDITNDVISVTGGTGGKAIEAGRGISITTGETADTVSFNLPISAGTGTNSIVEGDTSNIASGVSSHVEGLYTKAMSYCDHAEGYKTYANGSDYAAHAEGYQTSAMTTSCHAEGRGTKASGDCAHAEGISTTAIGKYSHAEGDGTKASGYCAHAEGSYTIASSVSNFSGIVAYSGYQARHAEGCGTLANNGCTHVEGYYTLANNFGEHASGVYNISSSASTTFGDSGNTLFSVGNGTADNARHNAFEIRQNGDIYITSGGTDIKLQDNLGGGGSSINVVQTTGTSTGDVMSQDAVTTALSGKADAADLGGLKLQQVTQAQYDAITNKDASTLYVIVN